MFKRRKKSKSPTKLSGSIQDRINRIRESQIAASAAGDNLEPADNHQPQSHSNDELQDTPLSKEEAHLQDYMEELRKLDSLKPTRPRPRQDAPPVSESDGDDDFLSLVPPTFVDSDEEPASEAGDEEIAPPSKDWPPRGAILLLATGEIGIFDRDVPAKDYQLVHMLGEDGVLNPEGIYLAGYEFGQIGRVPKEMLDGMVSKLVWHRDTIVFHLDRVEHASLVPHVARKRSNGEGGQGKEAANGLSGGSPADPAPEKEKRLVRGQRFRIAFGSDKMWEAVFWGKDQQGTVVAHKTSGAWALMHLSLRRFADTMVLDGKISDRELTDIEAALKQNHR